MNQQPKERSVDEREQRKNISEEIGEFAFERFPIFMTGRKPLGKTEGDNGAGPDGGNGA